MKLRTFLITVFALSSLVVTVAATAQAAPQASGTGRIRVIHASPGTPDVDVYLGRSTTPLISHLTFGGGTGFLTLPVATYSVSIRPAGAPPETAPIAPGNFVNSEGAAARAVSMVPQH